jgi:hypothetical protein
MIRRGLAALVLASAACAACAPPGAGPLAGDLAPDASLRRFDAGDRTPDRGKRDPGAVCAQNDDCRSGNCEKLFVCEQDRAVSCRHDDNDCAANGLPGSACIEERTGTCSPSAPTASGPGR